MLYGVGDGCARDPLAGVDESLKVDGLGWVGVRLDADGKEVASLVRDADRGDVGDQVGVVAREIDVVLLDLLVGVVVVEEAGVLALGQQVALAGLVLLVHLLGKVADDDIAGERLLQRRERAARATHVDLVAHTKVLGPHVQVKLLLEHDKGLFADRDKLISRAQFYLTSRSFCVLSAHETTWWPRYCSTLKVVWV